MRSTDKLTNTHPKSPHEAIIFFLTKKFLCFNGGTQKRKSPYNTHSNNNLHKFSTAVVPIEPLYGHWTMAVSPSPQLKQATDAQGGKNSKLNMENTFHKE